MINSYLRLPSSNPTLYNVRFTKRYRSGHIQLYDVTFRYDWFIYPNTIEVKNTILLEEPTKKIRNEIISFMLSFKFRLKEPDEMSEREYNYLWSY